MFGDVPLERTYDSSDYISGTLLRDSVMKSVYYSKQLSVLRIDTFVTRYE
jgi:hypothetical protein